MAKIKINAGPTSSSEGKADEPVKSLKISVPSKESEEIKDNHNSHEANYAEPEVKAEEPDADEPKEEKKPKGKFGKGKFKKGTTKSKGKKSKKEAFNEMNEIEQKIHKEYRAMKIRRWTFSGFILIGALVLITFGTYNTFFKKPVSPAQIAANTNNINRTTAFPSDGIDGYLRSHIKDLLKPTIQQGDGVSGYDVDPDKFYITYIYKQSDSIAQVYFTASVKTQLGEKEHNFIIPIFFNWNNLSYHPAGNPAITTVNPKNSNEVQDNPITSFGDSELINADESAKAQTFVNNFYIMVFNQKADVTPYYKGKANLGDEDAHFESITEFKYYQKPNAFGVNSQVTYQLSTKEGLFYTVTSYLLLEPSGDSYVIKYIQ